MTRLLVGPANSAGQATAWSRALRSEGIDARSLAFRRRNSAGRLTENPDLRLPPPRLTTRLGRERRARRLLKGFSHLALDGFTPIVGKVLDGLSLDELSRLSAWGLDLSLIAHGSDVRDPDRHMSSFPHSYFRTLPESLLERLRGRSRQNRAIALSAGLPVFVSTPDLLADLPWAKWLPLCVDPDAWISSAPRVRGRPRILHAPSTVMKGSDIIDGVLSELDSRGIVEYLRPTGVPHALMPELVSSADVVIDQIRSGAYGVASVEAMMSGKVVVAHLADSVVSALPKPSGIFDAPPSQFETKMVELLDLRSDWPRFGREARSFAGKWHSGSASAAVLRTMF